MLHFIKEINIKKISIINYGKEIFWVGIGQLFAFIGTFVGIKFLTKYLGPKGYGELALGLTIAFIINQIITSPISQAAYRFFSEYREKKKLHELLSAIIKIVQWAIVLIFSISFLIVILLNKYLNLNNNWRLLIFVSIIFGIFTGFNSIFEAMQNAARQRIIVAFHQGLLPWMRTIAAIIMVFLIGKKGSVAMIGYCLGLGSIVVSQFFFSERLLKMTL